MGYKPTNNKYGACRTVVDGISFMSRREAARYKVLKAMEQRGEIKNLELQQRFEIVPKHGKNRAAFYVADFVYDKADGEHVVEDCKGYRTDLYKLKKKMFEYRYDTEILET